MILNYEESNMNDKNDLISTEYEKWIILPRIMKMRDQ